MSLWIGRSGTGRMAVVDHIPQDYIAGPFMSADTAFQWLTERDMKAQKWASVRKTAADIVICAALFGAMVAMQLPGG